MYNNPVQILIPKEQFLKELDEYINQGESLIRSFNIPSVFPLTISKFEREIEFWNKEVIEFLKARLNSVIGNNTYLNEFIRKKSSNLEPIAALIAGVQIDVNKSELKNLINHLQSKVDVLIQLKRNSKYIDAVNFYDELFIENQETKMKRIFISHSSSDKAYVEKIIDILGIIGVPSDKIFCTSFEGYGVALGDNFLEKIKSEFDNDLIVIFVLSKNFYKSPICLCEMGATWIKTKLHIPILIPPFKYENIKGVIPQTNGMMINDKLKYNSLKVTIEEAFKLSQIDASIWERKRDNVLDEILILLNK